MTVVELNCDVSCHDAGWCSGGEERGKCLAVTLVGVQEERERKASRFDAGWCLGRQGRAEKGVCLNAKEKKAVRGRGYKRRRKGNADGMSCPVMLLSYGMFGGLRNRPRYVL